MSDESNLPNFEELMSSSDSEVPKKFDDLWTVFVSLVFCIMINAK